MELLKKLTSACGPSGSEQEVRQIILDQVKGYADSCDTDALGNLIVHKKGPGKKLMLTTHMDEVGFIVTVAEKDSVYVGKIGDVNLKTLQNTSVKFENDTIGIISTNSDKTLDSSIKIDDFKICILNNCKANKLNSISTGNVAVFDTKFYETDENICGKALDGRIGCFILIETLKALKSNDLDLYFTFTVQKHLGSRGAKTAVNSICPDYALDIDVTPCDEKSGVELGQGPALKVMDGSILCHPVMKTAVKETADSLHKNLQYEILEKLRSDSGAVHTAGVGVITGGLSVPCKFQHTPTEIVCKSDIQDTIAMLTKLCEGTIQ